MEKYNLKVESINPAGEPDQHGNSYYWIAFEGGKTGLFGCKEQDLFTVGQESEFYLETKIGKSGKEYSKIRRVSSVENPYENNQKKSSTGGPGGGENSKEIGKAINRAVAVKAVCQYRAQSSRSIEDIIKEADQLYDYIQFGIQDGPSGQPADGHQEALKTPKQIPDHMSGLPF